ncbi:Rap1a/Tai family immunity protein [Lichenifustis flavocetrariae]|uniref:Rap1a/Tai family immunity protein n=1 Tax=Lichenifustis flavocetrariae TaxID=2949735 RepID=UPI003D0FA6A4
MENHRGRAGVSMRSSIGIVILLMGTPAFAEMKASDFSAACSSPPGSAADQLCAAYVNGLTAGILVDQAARLDGTQICLPEGISTTGVRETLKAYLGGDARTAQLPAAGLITAALQAAYGCKRTAPPSPVRASLSQPSR